ncbi:hypothetical protein ACFOPQ_02350, partial [Deinococcus antarcticus]
MTFVTSWFVAVGLDGRNITANALSVAGSKWEPYPGSLKTFTNVPVRVSAPDGLIKEMRMPPSSGILMVYDN